MGVPQGPGTTGLCLAAQRSVRAPHPLTHTHCCHHGGKASWQRGHPDWAAAPSTAPKLLIMGKVEKNKTRCFFEHFWHSEGAESRRKHGWLPLPAAPASALSGEWVAVGAAGVRASLRVPQTAAARSAPTSTRAPRTARLSGHRALHLASASPERSIPGRWGWPCAWARARGPCHLPPPLLRRGHGLCGLPEASCGGNEGPAVLWSKVTHDRAAAAAPRGPEGGGRSSWGLAACMCPTSKGAKTPGLSLTPAPGVRSGKDLGRGLCGAC